MRKALCFEMCSIRLSSGSMCDGMCEIVILGISGLRLRALSPNSDLSSSAIFLTSSVLLNLRMILSLFVVAVLCMVAGSLLCEICLVMRLITSGAVTWASDEAASDLGGWMTIVECVVCLRTMSEYEWVVC